MFLDRKPFSYLWHPLRRAVVHRVLLPSLGRVRTFFAAQIVEEVNQLRRHHVATTESLVAIERQINSVIARNNDLVARLAALEAEQARQWNNLSKLLLCIYQQPKSAASTQTTAFEEPENALSNILIKNSFVAACDTSHRNVGSSEVPAMHRPSDGSRAY